MRRRAHAARAQELLQLAIERVDDENVRNQTSSHVVLAHRTNSTLRRNEAVSSTLPPPCVNPGIATRRPQTSLLPVAAHALDEEPHDVRDVHRRLAVGRAGEEGIEIEQRHRHDAGASRIPHAVGADARRAAPLNRSRGGVPGSRRDPFRSGPCRPARPLRRPAASGRSCCPARNSRSACRRSGRRCRCSS